MKQRLLTPAQRSLLAVLARRAWAKLDAAGAIEISFDEYRHEKSIEVCGRKISEARPGDFDILFVTFKAAAGDIDAAYRRASSRVDNQCRTLIHRIHSYLDAPGITLAYGLKIARDKFGWTKPHFEGLAAYQLEQLSWDIKRAVRRKLTKTTDA